MLNHSGSNSDIGSSEKNQSFLFLVCFVASLGGILFGFDTAVISGTFNHVEQQFSLSKLYVGWFGSSALVGAILGALFAGYLSDRFGRKPILTLAAWLFFISAVGSTVPPAFNILILARLVGGLGVGMASVLAPMYISEFSPPKIRGRLVALYQLSIVIGILLAYFSNWSISNISDLTTPFQPDGFLYQVFRAEIWRGMFGAEMIPAGLFIILLWFIPESPRWLIKTGKDNEGLKILTRITETNFARQQLLEIKNSLKREEGTIRELLNPGLRLALIVGIGLSFFGQLTGVNIIVYYGPTILENAGYQLGSSLQYQVAIGVINLIFTILALWKIDNWGRRPLLIGGMGAVFVSLLIIAILFSLGSTSGFWIVIMLCIYMACLALSINAVIWVLTGEIFPNRIRGRAMSIATFANWGTNFATAFLFPWYVAQIGINMGFYTFAATTLIATIFFWYLVPETKGKSLEEIEIHWKNRGGG